MARAAGELPPGGPADATVGVIPYESVLASDTPGRGSGLKSILLVALGGAIGSVARFKLSGWLWQQSPTWRFPAGTFAVNVIGCFIAGLLAGMAVKQDVFTPETRVFLFTGLLGGFTTFSAFGLETALLLKRGEAGVAVANIVLSIAAGLAAAWLGYGMTARGA